MSKPKILLFLFCLVFLLAFPSVFAQETITITTYYPSPYGSYGSLQADKLGVGDNNGDGSLTTADVPTTTGNVWIKGNVGIGTTNPTDSIGNVGAGGVVLDVSGSGGGTIKTHYTPVATYGEFAITKGSNGNFIDSAGAATLANNNIIFRTGRTASNFTLTEAMRIQYDGYVGIGTTGPTHLIHLSGGAYCDGTGDWIAGSDRAYKKDIDYNFKYGLKTIVQLRPVYYIHKQDKTNKKQIGFIAQDIKGVIPELVSGEEGSYGFSYGQLTTVLVNAIKEQQKEIEGLKQEIQGLKKKL